MILRRLYLCLLALMLSAAGGFASAGTVYTFGGAATVGNCTLSGAVYTCPSLPLTAWDDDMVIVSGYTVKITADTTFGYNHSLKMSGSAVLMSTGDLDIGGIATNNLKITGGTLIAGDVFSVGAQNQTLTANIQAVTANLGTGSDLSITGSIKATGTVNVASHATINGPISGATVTTNSPVTLVGDIVATNSFTLASGSTVKGNVTAPVVRLMPSSSSIQGNITAKTSLQLGSSDTVTGDVTAGTLTLDSSEATVYGNATIDSGVFNWHGRVTKTIYCSGGTTAGKCDCVSNNSGYEVNTANGPHCQGNVVPLDHFLIGYDQAGSLCEPSKVTITACANQACTALYGGGANVTLSATGQSSQSTQSVAVPASGSVQASVSWSQTGTFTLGVSGATTANATICKRNDLTSPGADCKIAVTSSAYTLTTNGDAFYAEAQAPQTVPTLTLAAVRYDDNRKECVPLFNNTTRTVTFTCAYANPTKGTLPVRLNGKALNSAQNAASACDNTGVAMSVALNANGKATIPMQYADAGAVTINATDSGSGSPGSARTTTTFVPAKFALALPNANVPYVAGKEFMATVTALNGNATATPNFGLETAPESAKLDAVACQPNTSYGLPGRKAPTLSNGVQTFKMTWSETGRIDLNASLASGSYLGSGLQPAAATTSTVTPGCSGTVGTFSPGYFGIEMDTGWTRMATLSNSTFRQYYAGEPAIKLTVTAYSLLNNTTKNYAGTYARDVLFTGLKPDGTALSVGAFGTPVRAADFKEGVATWTGSYAFTTLPTAQTLIRVRATEDLPAAQYPASSSALPAAAGTEPTLLLRSGRIRLPSPFGAAATALRIPVSLEYYTGQTWVLNAEDSTTTFPSGSVVSTGTGMGAVAATLAPLTAASGRTFVTLTPPAATGRGTVPFALNLGTTNANTSCYAAKQTMTSSTGAALAFLRSADASCTGAGIVDPSALATFGVYAPETKRIIHTREVFR